LSGELASFVPPEGVLNWSVLVWEYNARWRIRRSHLPVSRDTMPKQFLPLMDDRSTYQQALTRVGDAALFAAPS
jgi:hypothetical protein